jgi:hypothetical protein
MNTKVTENKKTIGIISSILAHTDMYGMLWKQKAKSADWFS